MQKSIGIDEIVRNISFILEEKEKAALIGVNGAGKTSVFRLLTGEWQPDGGEIIMTSDTQIGYLPQLAEIKSARTLYDELDAVFAPLKKMEADLRTMEQQMATLTGEDLERIMARYARLTTVYEKSRAYESASRVRGVLKGLGFPESEWTRSVETFSGGQQTRASLGKLLLAEPDLLLLDEPTNHLDIDSVAWLEDYLRAFTGAVIVVSHDRYFLDRVVTKTIEIENKKSVVYFGNYSHYAAKKVVDRENALDHYLQQQKIIKHHEAVIKTLRSFKTEAAIIRAKSREKMLDKIERVEKPESLPDKMRLILTPKIQSGNEVLTVTDVSMAFDKGSDPMMDMIDWKPLFYNISFALRKGDKTALIGPNGIGKTTLFKIIMGEITPLSGNIREGVNVRVGYYDQAQQQLSEEKTVFQELADSYPRLTQAAIRNVLAAFVFTGDDVFKPIAALSGGERGRVSLAKIMLGGANFLILDEPTNHLDMYSKEILEEALRDFPGTVLYISHDRYFINNTATRILEMQADGLTVYLGNYDYYVEKKKEQNEQNERNESLSWAETETRTKSDAAFKMESGSESNNESKTGPDPKSDWQRKKERAAEARKYKARLARLETEITETEERIDDCERRLADESVARDAIAAAAVYEEKTALEATLLSLYEEWHDMQEA